MLSGSELSEWAVIPTEEAKEYARRLSKEVGCPTGDSLQMVDCLRHYRSFEQIVNASAKVPMLVSINHWRFSSLNDVMRSPLLVDLATL